MPTPRSSRRGVAVTGRARLGAVNQRSAQHDRQQQAIKALISDAKRGEQYASSVEMHLQGLGSAQLRAVVLAVWTELARRGSSRKPDLPTQPD